MLFLNNAHGTGGGGREGCTGWWSGEGVQVVRGGCTGGQGRVCRWSGEGVCDEA